MRVINVAAAQMGPIQRSDSRQTVIPRMLVLMDEAKARGADLIVYPELALTTFFPRWLCVPKTLSGFIERENRISWCDDRADLVCSGHLGVAVQVEEPA